MKIALITEFAQQRVAPGKRLVKENALMENGVKSGVRMIRRLSQFLAILKVVPVFKIALIMDHAQKHVELEHKLVIETVLMVNGEMLDVLMTRKSSQLLATPRVVHLSRWKTMGRHHSLQANVPLENGLIISIFIKILLLAETSNRLKRFITLESSETDQRPQID